MKSADTFYTGQWVLYKPTGELYRLKVHSHDFILATPEMDEPDRWNAPSRYFSYIQVAPNDIEAVSSIVVELWLSWLRSERDGIEALREGIDAFHISQRKFRKDALLRVLPIDAKTPPAE